MTKSFLLLCFLLFLSETSLAQNQGPFFMKDVQRLLEKLKIANIDTSKVRMLLGKRL